SPIHAAITIDGVAPAGEVGQCGTAMISAGGAKGTVPLYSGEQPSLGARKKGNSPRPVITIDFTGTGPVLSGNLNANRAIVPAAVMYVLRLLIAEEIPLNEGMLAPVRLVLPQCLLNPPESESA